MTAVEFLREKGILKEPYNEWVINFHNGIRVDIVKLMEHFVTMEKQQQVTKCEQMATNSSQPQTIIGEHSIQMLEISDEEIDRASSQFWEDDNPKSRIWQMGARWYRKQLKQRK